MKNLNLILTATIFTIGIGSAFASHFAFAQLGYTRAVDVSGQVAICQARLSCDQIGEFACLVNIGGVDYQLYQRTSTAPVVCETPLLRSFQ